MAGVGHNSVSADELRLFVERIERLADERKGITDDIRDVMTEAKATGYETSTIREVLKLRKMTRGAREERDALLETYRNALLM